MDRVEGNEEHLMEETVNMDKKINREKEAPEIEENNDRNQTIIKDGEE